jgi:hypothetical protein
MTYFAVVPPSLKRRARKIAIVFNYEAFRFEAWLSATNRQLQRKSRSCSVTPDGLNTGL